MKKRFFPRWAAILASSLAFMALNHFGKSLIGFISSEFFFLFCLPLGLALLLGLKRKQLNLSLGKPAEWLPRVFVLLALAAPLLWWGSTLQEFQSYYPVFSWARESLPNLAAYELLILLLLVFTEFFFRGFLMGGVRTLGREKSVGLQLAPYILIHLGKPWLELPASALAGTVFGYLDWESESIAPSIMLHWGINVLFDLLCLYSSSGLPY